MSWTQGSIWYTDHCSQSLLKEGVGTEQAWHLSVQKQEEVELESSPRRLQTLVS